MKPVIRRLTYTLAGFYIAVNLFPGLAQANTWGIISSSILFIIIELILNPVSKWILKPLRFLILGAVGIGTWLEYTIYCTVVDILSPQLQFTSWQFAGIDKNGITIAPFHVPTLLSVVICAIVLMITRSYCSWLTKR